MKGYFSNWGNYPTVSGELHIFKTPDDLSSMLKQFHEAIPRGMGRSYGDSSLAEHMISNVCYKKVISFDAHKGTIHAQSGISLSEILELIMPKGWFLSVTPGTKFVSLGGAIAADVHGKNHHHVGSFCEHVEFIEIMNAQGEIQHCSSTENKELFEASCGGMGLTGIIVSASIVLIPIRSSKILQRNIAAKNLKTIMALFDAHHDAPYSVAWIDCFKKGKALGQSILMLGEHSKEGSLDVAKKRKWLLPFYLPRILFNSFIIRFFNIVYFHLQKRRSEPISTDHSSYFYPLDAIESWNRMYGRKGFVQYQFVLPLKSSYEGLHAILSKIADAKSGSFLAVLKKFGKQHRKHTFPMEGYTLALDFPVSSKTFALLEELDRLVVHYEGRIYLAKDARMNAQTFSKMDTYLYLKEITKKMTPRFFKSHQTERLGLS